jgi:formylglycine-generating enzyme required for sulfatase activity
MNANDIEMLRNSPESARVSEDVQYWLHSILHLQSAYAGPADVSCLAIRSAEAQAYQRLFADVFGIPLEVISPKLGIRLRLVPPGTFLMGSLFCEEGRQPHLGPQHEVTITKPMYVATTPITVRTFLAAACNDEIGSTFAERSLGYGPGGVAALLKSEPHERVHEFRGETIKPFIQRLDFMEGFPASKPFFRLPTEAEWEYSCRAGTLKRPGSAPSPR